MRNLRLHFIDPERVGIDERIVRGIHGSPLEGKYRIHSMGGLMVGEAGKEGSGPGK